jgi:hypothetical protein
LAIDPPRHDSCSAIDRRRYAINVIEKKGTISDDRYDDAGTAGEWLGL